MPDQRQGEGLALDRRAMRKSRIGYTVQQLLRKLQGFEFQLGEVPLWA
jgi:hypothetical protein